MGLPQKQTSCFNTDVFVLPLWRKMHVFPIGPLFLLFLQFSQRVSHSISELELELGFRLWLDLGFRFCLAEHGIGLASPNLNPICNHCSRSPSPNPNGRSNQWAVTMLGVRITFGNYSKRLGLGLGLMVGLGLYLELGLQLKLGLWLDLGFGLGLEEGLKFQLGLQLWLWVRDRLGLVVEL